MGWIEREWYLGPYKAELFDTAGNAGPTVWWDGRIVGGWMQNEAGEVIVQMLEDIGAEGQRAVDEQAERLERVVRRRPRYAEVPLAALEGRRAMS